MDEPEFGEPEEPFDSFAPGPEDEPLFDAPDSTAPATNGPASTAPAPLALYRRYRPDTFADVIGQEHVTEPLQRALTNNRVNHAYLFSGPRGCGKTTSARILARALNCELGPRAEPCGQCQSCRDLARGGSGSIDVIEIDAASHGGVDDARDLRERAFFAPVASRYKIYIVDEAHMVTTAGFNALLKLVEEPPPHVKFIFATTEPDKVIGTIRSRTHHYPFRLVPPRVLSDYLVKLCAAEGIPVESVVLPLVVRAGAGSVRDSLSVLDQLLGGAEESGVSYSQATALLGYTPDSLLDEFMDAFAAGDAGGVFACVDKVIEVGQDPRRFAEDLLRRLRDLVIVAAVSDALTSGLVEVAPDQADRLSSQAAALGAGELTRAAEVMAAGLTDMRGTTAPRLHLELMCARVLLPGADVDNRGIHARLDRLERRAGMTGVAQPSTRPEPTRTIPDPTPTIREPTRTIPEPVEGHQQPTPTIPDPTPTIPEPTPTIPEPTPTIPEPTPTIPEPVEGHQQPTPGTDPPGQAPTSRPSAAKQAEDGKAQDPQTQDRQGPAGGESDDTALGSAPGKDAGSPMSVVDVRRLWPEVLEEVKGKRRFTWILLSQNAQVHEVRNGNLLLSMANVGARDSFSRGGSEDVLKEALIVVLGVEFKIETMVEGGTGSPAPARPGPVSVDAARSWNNPAPAPAEPPATQSAADSSSAGPSPADPPPARPTQADPRRQEQARQSIRPTRQGRSAGSANDERDSAATLNDSDLEDSSESHTELLARHLGAEIIAEEEHGA